MSWLKHAYAQGRRHGTHHFSPDRSVGASYYFRVPPSGRRDIMTRFVKTRSGYLGIGLIVGLIIGLNIEGLWPNVPLHAAATHGIDKFAIATGLVDNTVEALYFLDFLTGDMRAAVINPTTGKFT